MLEYGDSYHRSSSGPAAGAILIIELHRAGTSSSSCNSTETAAAPTAGQNPGQQEHLSLESLPKSREHSALFHRSRMGA